jgi:hypothetical protein
MAKSPITAFKMPLLARLIIDDKVLSVWRTLTLSLPKWNEKLFLATSASDDLQASKAAIEVREDFFRTKTLNFKTPAKQKRSSDEGKSPTLSLFDMSTYSPFFKADEEAPITDIRYVAGVLVRFDEGIMTNKEAIMNFIHDYHQEHGKAGDAIRALWLPIITIQVIAILQLKSKDSATFTFQCNCTFKCKVYNLVPACLPVHYMES